MDGLILFEDHLWAHFLPLVYWRPVCALRCGRGSLLEHSTACLNGQATGLWVRDEIAAVTADRVGCGVNRQAEGGTLLANARWIPLEPVEGAPEPSAAMLGDDIAFVLCDEPLARQLSAEVMLDRGRLLEILRPVPRIEAQGFMLSYPWDLIARNGELLRWSWHPRHAALEGRVHPDAHILGEHNVHLGRDSVVKPGAVIDAEEGPIWIGRGVTIMPNAVVQGPTCLGDDTVINAGAWIRTNVSIGPDCKVGGEVGASILQGWSNKQHLGFLGHSYVAAWVNLGAGTTTSNLKNTYGTIKVPLCGRPLDSGEVFLGAIISDFAKTGINQTLTTGSVIGFGSSVATSCIGPAFTPSFRFITDGRDEAYDTRRCREVAGRVMARRRLKLSPAEQSLFDNLPAIAERHESI